MAILVKAINKQLLISKIKSHINKGFILSWQIDNDGDFSLAENAEKHFWIRPRLNEEEGEYNLIFGVVGNTEELTSKHTYAIAHTCFTEMLLTYFDIDINCIKISSFAMKYDNLTYTLKKNE